MDVSVPAGPTHGALCGVEGKGAGWEMLMEVRGQQEMLGLVTPTLELPGSLAILFHVSSKGCNRNHGMGTHWSPGTSLKSLRQSLSPGFAEGSPRCVWVVTCRGPGAAATTPPANHLLPGAEHGVAPALDSQTPSAVPRAPSTWKIQTVIVPQQDPAQLPQTFPALHVRPAPCTPQRSHPAQHPRVLSGPCSPPALA